MSTVLATQMVSVLPDYPILIGRVILSTILLGLYAFDLLNVFDRWIDGKDRRKGSDLRALVKSINLNLGLLIILLGAVTQAFFNDNPLVRDILRWLGYTLLGTLLVGGIALAYSWIEERRALKSVGGDRRAA